MKVLILGIDGYIGYSLAIHLMKRGHIVAGIDDFSRRGRVASLGGSSLTPISLPKERAEYFRDLFGEHFRYFSSVGGFTEITLGRHYSYQKLYRTLGHIEPDAIVHLAEQPSAPFSMRSVVDACTTQEENVIGTLQLLWAMKDMCPQAHLIKLGTMGEYGTPDCDIPEGRIPPECISGLGEYCDMAGLMFPRTAGSFYHLSKVHDTHNIEFACRTWKLRSTDIMQGVVFGLNNPTDVAEITRFDYDEYFGTVINRFCTQAIINHPLTIYGGGGQTRGYLPLKDSLQCLTIALENPPNSGVYRTFNQFESTHSVNELAMFVRNGAKSLGLEVVDGPIKNPRIEAERHHYNPIHDELCDLGYKPTTDIQGEITSLIEQILPYKKQVRTEIILPTTKWR